MSLVLWQLPGLPVSCASSSHPAPPLPSHSPGGEPHQSLWLILPWVVGNSQLLPPLPILPAALNLKCLGFLPLDVTQGNVWLITFPPYHLFTGFPYLGTQNRHLSSCSGQKREIPMSGLRPHPNALIPNPTDSSPHFPYPPHHARVQVWVSFCLNYHSGLLSGFPATSPGRL